jgi:hypothetical protein
MDVIRAHQLADDRAKHAGMHGVKVRQLRRDGER